MNAADVSALAHRSFGAQGPKAIAKAARKAASFESAGDKEQAKFWRRVD